jgi:hypothetical protein
MEHNAIRHMLSEYLDGSVSAQDKTEIENHLKTCPECENALQELRKTVEQIKSIEEIEPPAWMTQKIMAKVRAEAEEQKGFFQRLFFPLSIKLPIQAVAVAFLTITVLYVYRDTQPTSQFAEAPLPPTQEFTAKKKAPSPAGAGRQLNRADDSQDRSKQVPQTPEYKALDMKPEYEAPAAPTLKGKMAESTPAPARPAEQPAPTKREMMMEKRAAAPQAAASGLAQEETSTSAGSAPQMKAAVSLKRAKELSDKDQTGGRLERAVVEQHANGRPRLIVTYQIIDSRKIKIAEERFNANGERHGIQQEFYASGQLKTEALYGNGKLESFMEYGPEGVKKIGESKFDWLWLKK